MTDYQQQAIEAARNAKALFKCDGSPADDLARELYALERLAQAIDRNTAAMQALLHDQHG